MIHTLVGILRTLRPSAMRSTLAAVLLSILMLPSLSACAVFAQMAGAFPQVKPAVYKNMAGKSVAVMVWAEDQGVRIEHPRIQLDIAQMVISKLKQTQKDDKPDDLKLTSFPVSAGSVARFQEEHTELAADSIEEIAPRLGTERVIYIEIHNFQTRSEVSNDLFRGVISGSVRMVEITNGKGRTVSVSDDVKISYPRSSPAEGLPGIGDFAIYNGTLEGFATEVAKQFAPHADDPDADYNIEKGSSSEGQ